MNLKTTIPPPVYMLIFLLLMWALDNYLPLYHWINHPWSKIGWGVMGVGLLIDLSSVGLFFRARTSINPMKPENASTLVQNGVYRYTRNPMYLGILIILSGWSIYLGSLTPLLCLPLFVIILTQQQITPEEKALEKVLGQAYLKYKKSVPRWL